MSRRCWRRGGAVWREATRRRSNSTGGGFAVIENALLLRSRPNKDLCHSADILSATFQQTYIADERLLPHSSCEKDEGKIRI